MYKYDKSNLPFPGCLKDFLRASIIFQKISAEVTDVSLTFKQLPINLSATVNAVIPPWVTMPYCNLNRRWHLYKVLCLMSL